jgi:hypothetical protein
VGGGARSDNCGQNIISLWSAGHACLNRGASGTLRVGKLTDDLGVNHSGGVHAIDARGRR